MRIHLKNIGDSGMQFKRIIIFIIIILFLIVIFQNLDITSVQLLFWEVEISLLLIFIIPFILGIITGLILISSYSKSKQKKDLS